MAELTALGVAWFRAHAGRSWVIHLPHYGAFTFEGSEAEAEAMRVHKARWEHEIAHKRSASVTDYPRASRCWNHRGYARLWTQTMRGKLRKRPIVPRYHCQCGQCDY